MGSDFFSLIWSPGMLYSTVHWNTESLSAFLSCMYRVLLTVDRPEASFTTEEIMLVSDRGERASRLSSGRVDLILLFVQNILTMTHTLFPVLDLREGLVIFEPDDSWLRMSVHCHAGTDLIHMEECRRLNMWVVRVRAKSETHTHRMQIQS